MPFYNRDPKMDHNFDNHPYVGGALPLRFSRSHVLASITVITIFFLISPR